MHSRIFKLASEPGAAPARPEDYFDSELGHIADYIWELSSDKQLDSLKWFADCTGGTLLEEEGDLKYRLPADKKCFLSRGYVDFVEVIKRLDAVNLEQFCNERHAIEGMLDSLRDAVNSRYEFYVDMDGCVKTVTDFICDAAPGEEYYVAGVLDYHF